MNKFRFKQKWTAYTSYRSRSCVLIPFIIALLIIPGDLMARSGAQLLIEKKDQQQLQGELLSVDVEELNLVLRIDGEGVKIYTDEIDSIRIKRNSTGWGAAGKGFLIGAGIGAGVGLIAYSDPDGEMLFTQGMFTLFLAGVFGILGAIHGGVAGRYKKRIQVKGESQSEIKKILKRLKRKALVKN
jgi:hypothetical protein